MVIFRAGLPVVVPVTYANQPEHVALVEFLTSTSRYDAAVKMLERHVVSWLAADVLNGVPWAQRYLNTTAKLSQSSAPDDRRQAAAGTRALMHVLSGTPMRVGRRRSEPLSPQDLANAAASIAKWRAVVDVPWSADRAGRASAVTLAVGKTCAQPKPHARALMALLRRPRVRKVDVVLALASWDTGLPVRRIRSARQMADLVYG